MHKSHQQVSLSNHNRSNFIKNIHIFWECCFELSHFRFSFNFAISITFFFLKCMYEWQTFHTDNCVLFNYLQLVCAVYDFKILKETTKKLQFNQRIFRCNNNDIHTHMRAQKNVQKKKPKIKQADNIINYLILMWRKSSVILCIMYFNLLFYIVCEFLKTYIHRQGITFPYNNIRSVHYHYEETTYKSNINNNDTLYEYTTHRHSHTNSEVFASMKSKNANGIIINI